MGRFINRGSSFRWIGERPGVNGPRRKGNDGKQGAEGNERNESNEGSDSNKGWLVDSSPPGEDVSDHLLVKHRQDQEGQ